MTNPLIHETPQPPGLSGRTPNGSSSSQQRPKGRKRGKVVASAAPGFLGKAMVKVDEPKPEPPGCARAVAFTPIPFDQKFRYIQLLLGSPEEPLGTQIMGSSVPSSGRGARGEQRGVMSSIVSSRLPPPPLHFSHYRISLVMVATTVV